MKPGFNIEHERMLEIKSRAILLRTISKLNEEDKWQALKEYKEPCRYLSNETATKGLDEAVKKHKLKLWL